MSTTTLAAPGSVLAHHPLGVSTGYMAYSRGDWPQQVRQAWDMSPFAVELSALSEGELDGLARYFDSAPRLPFRYLSIHGPSKALSMPEAELGSVLARLADRAQAIVLHPDTIEDPDNFRVLGRKLVLENMDARKDAARTVPELEPWFSALPQAGFCFDIAHAASVDPSMGVGQRTVGRVPGSPAPRTREFDGVVAGPRSPRRERRGAVHAAPSPLPRCPVDPRGAPRQG
jgi:hypothetical protein